MTTCKNCGNKFEGHFCNNCGQKASVGRLNWHYLWHEALHNIFHFDKNVLTVLRNLFIRPAEFLHEYINGKRVIHFSPFSMLVTFGAAMAVLFHFFDIPFNYEIREHVVAAPKPERGLALVIYWLNEHEGADIFAKLPLYALFSWLFFRKPRYNFVEHLTVNAICATQVFSVFILTMPFLLLLKGSDTVLYVLYTSIALMIIVPASTLVRFFSQENIVSRIIKGLAVYLLPSILLNMLLKVF